MIRPAIPEDIKSICDIYNHYIIYSYATFETEPVGHAEMGTRIDRVQTELKLPWIVIEPENKVAGYAYATQWKPRSAYSKTVETTVYIHKDFHGKGLGKMIYGSLVEDLKNLGYHVLLGGISLPNEESVKLHEKLGFIKIGQLREVGNKFDRWIDVGYWELMLG